MTDWYSMVDSIQAAMQAVDQAHEASETLRERKDREAMEVFQLRMKELGKHLEHMQVILSHEGTYTMDELADALSTMLGEGHTYRRIAPYHTKEKG